ncbi:UBX domain protein, partial [Cooperia oncophora]
ETRKAKASGLPPPEPSAPAAVPASTKHSTPAQKTDYKEAMIQVRLPSGQAVRQSFGASEPLSAVRLWLEINHSNGAPFSLLMPFPRKMMTDEDYDKPLKELGLVPSANFVMTP